MKLILAALFILTFTTTARADDVAKVHIGPGGQLIVGGFDPNSFETAAQSAKAFENDVPRLKSLGITSHEVYVRWNLCEVAPGKWDWSVYDRYVDIYKKNNIKWVPFLICGSPYSLPDWYYKKPGSQGYVCLEHHQESDVQSLWNPEMRRHVAEFIKAFCDHYRDSGTIESILLGVTGNYGEAIYPATGNDWTADRHGKYHTHPGFWAGDPFAEKSFADWVKKKYETSDHLKTAWGDKAPSIDDVKPFRHPEAPNDRAWLDFVDWYIGSMTDYAKFWLAETRKNFPGDIYLCTGGHAPAAHGADFGDQCKMAAEIHGGVRITNEASNYAANFTYTRWVASAGEQYGAYYSFEPAGGVDANGVVARVYNAAASGAKGLHYYWGNLFDKPEATENFIRTGSMFQQRKPQVEIAVFYPTTQIHLSKDPNNYIYKDVFDPSAKLRDRFDFNYISEHMIRDGGLKNYKALIVMGANVAEKETWEAIRQWEHGGGWLIYSSSNDPKTVEGEMVSGLVTSRFNSDSKSSEFRAWAGDQLLANAKLSDAAHRALAADNKEDQVFTTLMSDGELLIYNANTAETTTAAGTKVPPVSIISQPSSK